MPTYMEWGPSVWGPSVRGSVDVVRYREWIEVDSFQFETNIPKDYFNVSRNSTGNFWCWKKLQMQ